ncbi:succinate dehydrogenase / fumarate reductase membrane anchor subunit [Pseudorhodobacter antarcticus]|jgi:succinate dehydrogenase / fumarate reductase membrane anchor subunit|uniref:Succinate dehydrogenase hydrophobic membrane anchor subunit n=1 Tax=Pseudorhodobacter antarcticus TaxID=1077947 RepID=A0A1H8JG70_9RHOB|nr:succinate dehydrogenase, hydrophobic membrane anchor protein [Pseudorhodobacter antarcticus]SEN79425.1 succinate dehydrogenase / fumarate reductase membrane anchor subunit [Pseudorhodobacter antarcticus]
MRYLTDRKRAMGKGSARSGTEHHWYMTVTSVALAFMIPTWVYIFGSALGGTQAEVVATFARPFPAILTALVLFASMGHFAKGATMMIEDYAKGSARRALVILAITLSYAITATGLFALVRIAL